MLRKVLFNILLLILKGYRLIVSPFFQLLTGPGWGCRFEPTCSQYAIEALRAEGIRRGLILALLRVCRCHPWGGCGYDPVPQQHNRAEASPLPLTFKK